MTAPEPKELVTELVEALRAIHRGLDPNVGGPTMARNEILAIASKALARATPEAVRKADAAPEMYGALKVRQAIDDDFARRGCMPAVEHDARATNARNMRKRAIAKAEGKP